MAEKDHRKVLTIDSDLPFLNGLTGLVTIWKEVGDHLGVPVDQLEVIQENNRGGVHMIQDCLRDMFIWWLRNGKERTVEKLILAVHAVGKHNIEKKINEEYGFHHNTMIVGQSQCVSVTEFNLPLYVQRYCHDMKTRYLQQSVLPESDWPPSLGGQYIRLALIYQERSLSHHRSKGVIKQQIDYTRGDFDKILEYKTSIELSAAFDKVLCEGGSEIGPLKMLIDGAPGVGKTTLTINVSRMWAKGELLERFWLVLLLHLRERAISKAKTVDDFFYHEDSELQHDIVKFVKERSGDGVLIIFDGFDELSLCERAERSLFLDVCRGKILPKCAVVITSRPYASRSLQELPLINRHIEVLGFTDEQVKTCIRRKIKDDIKAEELCTELKDRLDVASICQIPLNCSIVLYVYEQENYSLPRTLTELYELFILHSLKRFIKRTPCPNVAADRLLDLKDLQSPSSGHFESLCTLAIKGLEEDKLVFSRNDVEKIFPSEYHKSERDLPVLDLMTSAKSYTIRGAQDTYSFLHLTIQEFLAAYWVAHYSPDTTKLELFQQKLMDSRFRMVLLFLSGMTKLTFPKVFDTFSQISWDKDIVHACHLLYESGNHNLYKSISNEYFSSTGRVVKLTGSRFDALVISHFIAYSDSQWDEVELRPDDVKIVHKVFSTCTVENTSIQNIVLNFHEWSGGDAELKLLDELNQINRINIPIRYNQKLASRMLSTALMGQNAIREKECTITWDYTDNPENCDLVEQFCKTLAECLAQSSSVTEVRLKSVLAEDIDQLFTHLSQGNTPVSKLTRLTCTIGQYKSSSKSKQPPVFQKFCTSLVRYLSSNTSLIQVDLNIPLHSDIFSSCVETVKSGLVHNKCLQKLNIKLFDGEVIFQRNIKTNEIELTEQYFQSSDCDPSPPRAKRPCRDNQECADFSLPGRRDSPYQLHTHGLDMAHPNQLQPHQFQPQTQKSNRLSVLSPLPPPSNNPVEDHGSPHDIMDLSVESPPPQDIQSPGLTDLTQDSPQPHDHVDNTHFHSHLSTLPSITTTPQLSSVIVKQENQFCQAKQLNSPPPSSGNYSRVHSHTMNPSVLAPTCMATQVFPPLPSANEGIGSCPLAQPRVLHQDGVVYTQTSHDIRPVQPVTQQQLGQSLNRIPPVQHYHGSSPSPSMGYTQSLPESQHLSQSPPDHPHHLDAPRHPISHATQTVTLPHQSGGATLMSHSHSEEQQRQMVASGGHLRLSRSHQDQLIHTSYQNLPPADNSQSTRWNKSSQSCGRRRWHHSHCGPYSRSRGSTLLYHQHKNFPPSLSVTREHQSNISDPVHVAQPIFSHQDRDFYARSNHERQLQQQRPSMSPSSMQNYYSSAASPYAMRPTLHHPRPFPQSPPNHPDYLPRYSGSQTTRAMWTHSHQWNVQTPLFPNSEHQQQQQQHGPWQMSSSSSDYGHSTSYRNRPLPSTYSLGSYQNSPSLHTFQSTQNQPSLIHHNHHPQGRP